MVAPLPTRHDAGLGLTEAYVSWLTVPPEQAALEARIEADHEQDHSDKISEEVHKVIGALRASGYEPVLRIEDIEEHGGGTLPAWDPEPYR